MASRRSMEDDDFYSADDDGALSPYEQALGGRWDAPGSAITPEAIAVYESGGADFGGGAPSGSRFDPTPDDKSPGIPGTTQKPTEVFGSDVPGKGIDPDQPPPPTISGGPGGGGRPTPSRPSEPSPISLGGPRPFTPLSPELSPSESALPGNVLSRVSARPSIFSARSSRPLFGRAGGLMGGGLGVPGVTRGGASDPTDLLRQIVRLLAGGR